VRKESTLSGPDRDGPRHTYKLPVLVVEDMAG
jgi:hypothetical protein